MYLTDGKNGAAYEKRLLGATNRRFAWEFLRRNPDFQRDCLAVRNKKMKAEDVAKRWGLRSFKDYRRSYFKPKRTTFNIACVRFYSKLIARSRTITLDLMPGEVAMVFDLNDVKKYRQVFDAKIIYAARGLERRARSYLGNFEKDAKNIRVVRGKRDGNLIRYLRAYDLHVAGEKIVDIHKTLHLKKQDYVDGPVLDAHKGRDDLIAGQDYVRGGYLKLVVTHYAKQRRPTLRVPRKKKKINL